MTKKLFIFFSAAIFLITACKNSAEKQQKEFLKFAETIEKIELPATFPKEFNNVIDFKEITDEEQIKFLDAEYTNGTSDYYAGFYYKFSQEIDILIWAKIEQQKAVLFMNTYYKGSIINTYELAGYADNYEYNSEITEDFKIIITEKCNDVEKKYTATYTYTIRNDGELIMTNEDLYMISSENIKKLFTEVDVLPYKSTYELMTLQLKYLTEEEIDVFIDLSADKELFQHKYEYLPVSYIDFNDKLKGYTMLIFPENATIDNNFAKEKIFLEFEGQFVAAYDLWSEDQFEKINSKLFTKNDEIYIQHEKTTLLKKDGYFVENDFDIIIYKLDDYPTTASLVDLEDVYDVSSFEYFYYKSKIGEDVDFENFKLFCYISEEECSFENLEGKIIVKPIAYFYVSDNSSAFVYHITDGMQNIFFYYLLEEKGKNIEHRIIESCMSVYCENFKVEKLYLNNNIAYNIQSKHSAGGFIQNRYLYWSDDKLQQINATAEEYAEFSGKDYYEYLFTLIDDDELTGITLNSDPKKILENIKSVEPKNDVIELNIKILELVSN